VDFDNVTVDLTVTAQYDINTYTIAVSANPTEGGNITGNGTFDHFESVTVTATANAFYDFVNWTEGGAEVSVDATYSFTASRNRTLVANFVLKQYTIAVSATPAISGNATGDGVYDVNSQATVEAAANTGYRFMNWTVGGSVVSTANPYSFTVTQDVALVANFGEVIDFDKYVATKWNNLFMLNLRQLANDGYTVTSCKWYRNGTLIGEDLTYSAGGRSSDRLDSDATYTFELLTVQGVKFSTDKRISRPDLVAYPNPVSLGRTLYIEGVAAGSNIEIYNSGGLRVYRTIAVESPTTLTLNIPIGVYVVRTDNGEVKIVVE
jgi:hypothetical protein